VTTTKNILRVKMRLKRAAQKTRLTSLAKAN
jgi:hypothetical protein